MQQNQSSSTLSAIRYGLLDEYTTLKPQGSYIHFVSSTFCCYLALKSTPQTSHPILTKLNIGQESSPAWQSIVFIQLENIFRRQLPTSRCAICGFQVSPFRSKRQLVNDGQAKDQDDANGVLEECRRRSMVLALFVLTSAN